MSVRKFFGTDGIRGKVGAGKMTPELALKLGWAAGRVLSRSGTRKVIIGKDTRISGYLFESALEAGLSAAGLNVMLMGPMPTPAVAYLTRTFRAEAGVVISASHNPYYDNGIKFFSTDGSKLDDELELEIEAELEKPLVCVESHLLGKVSRIDDAAGRYIEYCKGNFPADQTLAGLKIVVDCAHGATYHIAPNVFRELGAEVVTIGDKPNGININDQVGATSMAKICETVVSEGADLGIALDGDGDRIMMVNRQGEVIDGDQILYILACDAQKRGILKGGVVGTLMSNLGLELALKQLNIPFARSKVGDRYVIELLKEKDWRIGGENSGHILNLDHGTTGDGIVAGILVLAAMRRHNASLEELTESMKMLPQVLINVRFEGNSDPLASQLVKDAQAQVESQLGERGRVLLRKSGTEPLIRVMVEGDDEAQVRAHAETIATAVKQAV
ncbi:MULTISPECIES: phosphoglucosamine mutase [Shewanella]|uniref:Phosphoglucosamine mutase n=2 Tax=Unclassified Bacteria TaxID=49928 RepID=A0AAU6VMV2_UNCXX|nr:MULTISPECIES: phosphoglucosamine mutase [Shewanella]MBO2577087.1 phosphoglucosamine mutase [Shewanella algae]MBO2606755.1 phosphoglucosamine mutase [Shewanella algae]MBO2611102.1 phosphoglucosamine mutase [Shewanella algae]MBO2631980.1 phosphoglucosamine mutase [Shewanella algae]MBO2682630.1 phosphoglucosamine mutase [Shewanella algae]